MDKGMSMQVNPYDVTIDEAPAFWLSEGISTQDEGERALQGMLNPT